MGIDSLIISPHLDDAVLSATSPILAAKAADVVTVFAGVPDEGTRPGWWDRVTRAVNPAERVLQRVQEDTAAMAELGARAHHLDEMDGQHRDGPADTQRIANQLRSFVESAHDVWIPAGIGGHKDHIAVRDGALVAHETWPCVSGAHRSIHLYADVPYSIRYPWPGRSEQQDFLDAEFWLDSEMRRCGISDWDLTPEWSVMTPDAGARKLRAMRCYQTQWAALDLGRMLTADPDSLLRYELSWTFAGRKGPRRERPI